MTKAKKKQKKPGRIRPNVVYTRISPNQSARTGRIEILVLHSTEGHNRPGNSDLEGIANFFMSSSLQASAHVVVDDDGNSARCVPDERKAWHVGNLNSIALGIEQIGFAAQGRRAWRHAGKELKETARWLAEWSILHGIPLRKAKLTSGGGVIRSGVTTHQYCSAHGAGTSHWDPGDYPIGYVIWRARIYKALRLGRK